MSVNWKEHVNNSDEIKSD